jgi:hypothetical protein
LVSGTWYQASFPPECHIHPHSSSDTLGLLPYSCKVDSLQKYALHFVCILTSNTLHAWAPFIPAWILAPCAGFCFSFVCIFLQPTETLLSYSSLSSKRMPLNDTLLPSQALTGTFRALLGLKTLLSGTPWLSLLCQACLPNVLGHHLI